MNWPSERSVCKSDSVSRLLELPTCSSLKEIRFGVLDMRISSNIIELILLLLVKDYIFNVASSTINIDCVLINNTIVLSVERSVSIK